MKVALTAALVLLATPAFAKLAPKGDAQVDFFATGPGGLSIDGKTKDLAIADDGKKVVFTVPLKNLTTGIALRDQHMREKYLQVEKYPDATLEIARDDLKFPVAGKRSDGEVKGTFTAHGVSKPVTVKYKAHREKDGTLGAEGKFKINTKDHGIDVPSYLGVTVRPDMDLQVKFSASDE